MTHVEFTDRYGGHPPSWLRCCFGECEATGYYPVHAHTPLPNDRAALAVVANRALTKYERRRIEHRQEIGQTSPDGWYFLMCPDCKGTGRCSWFTTLSRIPRWLWRGVCFMWYNGPSSPQWSGHPSSWAQRVWLNFQCAFLADL